MSTYVVDETLKLAKPVITNSWWNSRRVATAVLVIVLAGVFGRLHLIGQPLAGIRQCDTAAIARNFAEGSMNIFYPQVDWRGETAGYVEAEFQIYTFLIAILYKFFGVHDWMGGVFNIAVFALSSLLLFRLTRRLFGEAAAVLAVLFYSVIPLSFLYTRTFQPDALMCLCSLAGIYYFLIWTEEGGWRSLVLSAIGIAVAALIKPSSLYLGLPLFYLCYRKFGLRLVREPVVWLYAVAVVLPTIVWFHQAKGLWETYGNSFGILGGWLPMDTGASYWVRFAKQLAVWHTYHIATPVGLLLLGLGFIAKSERRNYLFHWWVGGFAVSILIACFGKWHHNYLANNYYQLPIVFAVAAWMAHAAVTWWRWAGSGEKPGFAKAVIRVGIAALCVSTVALSIWQVQVGRLRPWLVLSDGEWQRIAFDYRVKQLTAPEAPVIFARSYRGLPAALHRTPEGEYLECDPVDFYRSQRKGWSLDEKQATPEFVGTLQARGAKYFATGFPEIFERHPELKAELDRSYTPVEVTPDWAIYRLDELPALGSYGDPKARRDR